MGRRRIKQRVRKKCRKCGELLVNKAEYGAICPKCGWCRGWYTNKEGTQAICDNDCEHCDWATCPKMEGEKQ